MAWLQLIIILGIVILYFKLRKVQRSMATQEEQLQDVQAVLGTVATGVTEIISRLNALPSDNPAIQDEIDGIRGVATNMRDQIDAALNSPEPES